MARQSENTKTRQPNPTESDVSLTSSGILTPLQERAAFLLSSGVSVGETATQLNVHRSTLWEWRRLETFQAFYNRLTGEIQQEAFEGVRGLYSDAVTTLRRLLNEGSDPTALRAALYVLGQIQEEPVGETDPREMIRKQFTEKRESIFETFADTYRTDFDETGYSKRCAELGIEP